MLGGRSWLCPALIRQVPGSQLLELAVTGVLLGNLEGEDITSKGDSIALPSLGNAVPSRRLHAQEEAHADPLIQWLWEKLVSVFGNWHK